MQGSGVVTSVKHFIGYEQETNRNPSGNVSSVSSNIDDKTIHELYLWPFQDALHAGAGCIMCSYNRINNSYACQNSKVLNGLLKTELGFEGFVVSDWDGQRKVLQLQLGFILTNSRYWVIFCRSRARRRDAKFSILGSLWRKFNSRS
jgi:beta-glucosidase